ncbi:hypothetical protein HUN58_03365 [Curtobacterium sp. Csp1]|uniref:Uncharacterized protein n=1 Tax=Curtobacterium citreum TaxID=2036 RepID=A0ABT2HM91_9MICO|nr:MULTISPECIES: hypothetical protein [Curtobacterium]MCS6524272.1 hypothetical protein [Curtobacterium citreum]QKS13551.1 hypothetical protein HUN60_10755 [Curtobacterium sp. csp3]QKS19072.1 hypothetical protein HUN58_03365 [Curtobacterium sp. Csp1]TQJ26337.1 hypothetical protein FB462_0164 [Curtobacterium citreum]GGL92735.1 hypothetical protein GCM10009706_34040 [Curtobacterium citreum]
MPVRSLDKLEDATFDVTAARVVSGEFMLHRSVVEHDTSAGTVRLPVTLTVPDAVSVVVDVADGIGELILETVDVTASAVTLQGVSPCTVVVTTAVQSQVLLDVSTTPVAVRRWWRWRPWDGTTPVILDHRAVSRRLRENACPACTHPWDEHPTERDTTGATCGECDYELEHGELPRGRAVCTAQIPQQLIEPEPSDL